MLKKRILICGLLSIIITLLSPYFFPGYVEDKPKKLVQEVTFGGPLPFVSQTISLPKESGKYPLEIKFQSPKERQTKFETFPLLFSIVIYFSIIFSLYTIFSRYLKKPIHK